jgi:hypothetical protein
VPDQAEQEGYRGEEKGSPFRGLALQIGIFSTILSQAYAAPPLRLHYHGFGELTSALLLSPVSFLFGLVAARPDREKVNLALQDGRM